MSLKARNWSFLVYPDSAPIGWVKILEESGLPFAISPLHDSDLWDEIDELHNPEHKCGEPKKAHYHVLTYFDGPTSYNNVLNNLAKPVGANVVKKVDSLKGMYEYHIHKNNKEKFQYDDRLRILLNGFDTEKVNELTATQVHVIIRSLIDFIIDNDITEYSDLIICLHNSDLIQMEQVATTHTIFLNTFISSRRNQIKEAIKNKCESTLSIIEK